MSFGFVGSGASQTLLLCAFMSLIWRASKTFKFLHLTMRRGRLTCFSESTYTPFYVVVNNSHFPRKQLVGYHLFAYQALSVDNRTQIDIPDA